MSCRDRILMLLVTAVALTLWSCDTKTAKKVDRPSAATVATPTKKAPDLPQKGPVAQKVLFEQAKGLLSGGRYPQATAAFAKAIEAHPKGPLLVNCYLGLGSALAEQGKSAEAVGAYRKVVELAPDDSDAHRALAIGLEEAGKLEKATETLERVLAMDPDGLASYQDLAALYLKRKQLDRAKEIYTRYEFRRTALIKTLGLAKDTDQRVSAALALGSARDEATAKALGLALTNRSRQVRAAVIRALTLQGLEAGAGPLRALLARSSDADEKKRIQAALQVIAESPQPEPPPAPPVPTEGDQATKKPSPPSSKQ